MNNAWLKMIGTAERHCEELYAFRCKIVDFRGKKPGVHRGDHLVLYAVGGTKHIFALAEVTSDVYDCPPDVWGQYRVNIDYIVKLPVLLGVDIQTVGIGRNWDRSKKESQ